jgi:glycosyltransferase involved in cell wall biosynthesis
MAARYRERQPCPAWVRRYRRWSWSAWLKRQRAAEVHGYLPDDEVHWLFDAADAVIVPRLKDLSSGIPSLAMTFGKLVIAPRHGAFPDYLAGSPNLLYESGDCASLARAIETAATLDRDAIGRENRRIADGWNWDKIVVDCLEACFRRDNRLDRGAGGVALTGGGAGASRMEQHRGTVTDLCP